MTGRRQTCKVCGRADYFNFNVPDEVWAAIVPEEFRCRVVCLGCFDKFARDKAAEYDHHIQTLYFAGDQASFEFRRS